MDQRSSNLLDEALGLDQTIEPWPLRGRLVAIEDRVDTSGSFVLHHLLKRSLSKTGGDEGITPEGGLIALYGKIHKTISALPEISRKNVSIIIDDLSLMEVAANGSSAYVLDFLHYCWTLTSEFIGLPFCYRWSTLQTFDKGRALHFNKGRAFGYRFSN